MKTLVVVSHPNIETSRVNKRLIEELKKHPDKYTVHELYPKYPSWSFDVEQEQKLIDQHEHLILQFPMYWFNCTPLLKKWLDDVFTYGWAYGSKGNQLKNKKVALCVSAGITEADFSASPISFDHLVAPFQASFIYTKADFKGSFPIYDANDISSEQLNEKAKEYLEFIDHL